MPLTDNKPDLICALQISRCSIWSSRRLLSSQQVRATDCTCFLLLRHTCNMCLLFSRASFREECGVRVPFGMSPSYSRLAGSLSSSLHENYSMGEFKDCGVHSVEQLAERHIHSLATQRVQGAQEKWKGKRD